MNLYSEVKDYIENSQEFDEDLALRVIEFQIEHIPFYRDFLKKTTGKSHFNSLSSVPPMPVEFFKRNMLFASSKYDGFFESSGTTGQKSRVYYNTQSLSLYKISAIRSYPLKNKPVKTFIDTDRYRTSSLAYMVRLFINSFTGDKIRSIEEVNDGDVLFLTASQLNELLESIKKPIRKKMHIVETGGYKKLNKIYSRQELYRKAKITFKDAILHTEYGMTELFSQFYASETSFFKDSPYIKVFQRNTGYLTVFDFANMFQVSYLIIPDIIKWNRDGFEYIKRDMEDERGCSYTFGQIK